MLRRWIAVEQFRKVADDATPILDLKSAGERKALLKGKPGGSA